jgi:adenylate cyclase
LGPTGRGKESEYWARILGGEEAAVSTVQSIFRKVPSPPRCKLCKAPFSGPYAPMLRLLGFRRWALNRQICRWCVRDLEKHKGGAEIDVSVAYVDIRDSTAIAESMSPRDFTLGLESYLGVVSRGVDAEQGVIDHMAGDGVMAFWIPGFVGALHALRALTSATLIATDIASAREAGGGFPAGVGVHTGRAYVGVVGEAGSQDFTIVGDVANTVARLSSQGAEGEVVISEQVARATNLDTSKLHHRLLQLKGKSDLFPAWVWDVSSSGPLGFGDVPG